jgi:hypothetical protein
MHEHSFVFRKPELEKRLKKNAKYPWPGKTQYFN